MHGVLFCELREFATAAAGPEGWTAITEAAGLHGRVYRPTGTYPDAELGALVAAASSATATPVPALLEGFGRFIAPHLLDAYDRVLAPGWRTLDVLEHVETTIHTAVRAQDVDASPPRLRARRAAPNEVRIVYASRRGLCDVARGIVHGVAARYGDAVTVEEPTCTHRGDAACELVVRLTPR